MHTPQFCEVLLYVTAHAQYQHARMLYWLQKVLMETALINLGNFQNTKVPDFIKIKSFHSLPKVNITAWSVTIENTIFRFISWEQTNTHADIVTV